MAGTKTGAVCEEPKLLGRSLIEGLRGGLSPVRGTPHWRGEECEEFFPKREGVSETPCAELSADSIP